MQTLSFLTMNHFRVAINEFLLEYCLVVCVLMRRNVSDAQILLSNNSLLVVKVCALVVGFFGGD